MQDFEKLGVFYLGKTYDVKKKEAEDSLLLYDSRDLVTHAVCVGMTGSGKTGLCLALLEEAAIDGIPAIVIDPKGDLSNLLLTFPGLTTEEFRPWVNEDDAQRKGVTTDQFAAEQAEMWKSGLAKWGQDGARIQRLRDAANFSIYTPGSNAGRPISILKSFAAPPRELIDDSELLGDRVNTTATSLLGLLGIDADPIKSREHILLSTILVESWKNGQDLDLAALIGQIQTPPFQKIGVLDIESFYPSKDRFELSLALNNLLAAPGFSAWLDGEPLDIGHFLYTETGKPRVSIFSIAHLSDAERMFFVSLLLTQTLGWVRGQSGTTSLRALLYMDEIFGYFPPVANPPSKLPLLTLLKQARAYGLGIVLSTQNPVDLDYKGLSNTGTWFIGRLQTERDKARVLEGLEGVANTAGSTMDRGKMDEILSSLGNRVFLMNNTHEDAPVVFQTRWALSYLRGPLTRNQIKTLASSSAPAPATTPAAPAAVFAASSGVSAAPVAVPAKIAAGAGRPLLPSDVPQYFVPVRGGMIDGATLVYQPRVLGTAQLTLADTKTGINMTQDVVGTCSITSDPVPVNWDNDGANSDLDVSDLGDGPEGVATFADLPSAASKAKSYAAWNKDFANWLFRTRELTLLRSPSSRITSKPDETERDFRIRLQLETREARDQVVEKLRQTYATKAATLEERLRRAQQAVEVQAAQARDSKIQTAISFGSTILGSLFGRKTLSVGSMGRAATAARGVSRSMKESQDIGRANETVETLTQQLQDLQAQLEAEVEALKVKSDPATEPLDQFSIKPKKRDITVRVLALAWMPYWQTSEGQQKAAFE